MSFEPSDEMVEAALAEQGRQLMRFGGVRNGNLVITDHDRRDMRKILRAALSGVVDGGEVHATRRSHMLIELSTLRLSDPRIEEWPLGWQKRVHVYIKLKDDPQG